MEVFPTDLRCEFCGKDFEKRNILKRHLREKHFCGNVYKCNMCAVSFVRKERLIRHLKSVHFDIKFHCIECGMKFVEKYKHNYHMVHSHGYSYCADCKVAYKGYKPVDTVVAQKNTERTKFPLPRKSKSRRASTQNIKKISISINNSNIRMHENNINVEMKLGHKSNSMMGNSFNRPGKKKCKGRDLTEDNLKSSSNSLDLTGLSDRLEGSHASGVDSPSNSSLNTSINSNQQEISMYTGHVCNNFVIYYKCFLSNCQGKKTYNRLNFFIRHLQLEHQISDFKKVKEIIENSTYEKRKSKKKSRIRAKTLEGNVEVSSSDNFKDLVNYAKGYSRSGKASRSILPPDIVSTYKRQYKSKRGRKGRF